MFSTLRRTFDFTEKLLKKPLPENISRLVTRTLKGMKYNNIKYRHRNLMRGVLENFELIG
jgi:hypothetical protein